MIKMHELISYGTPTPKQLDVIVEKYYIQLNKVRSTLKVPVFIRSCFRSVEHELSNGRSGTGEHTFTGFGAVDVALTSSSSVREIGENLYRLAQELAKCGFMRIAFYPKEQFFHCDYKGTVKSWFISSSDSKWTRVEPSLFYEEVLNND